METIRAFIAIEVPEDLRARLAALPNDLRRTGADVRWVRPEGIHLTLKFLGYVLNEDLERISSAIGPFISTWEAFNLRIRGLGCFPSAKNPRVIWAGIEEGGKEAVGLQKEIERSLSEAGFPPEDRPFTPHLTLGRVRSPKARAQLGKAVEDLQDVEIGPFRAAEVYLFQSELKPAGAVYTKLKTFRLREGHE